MSLPPSFLRDGFTPYGGQGLMMGTDGWSDSGKSEFALTAPEPIMVICMDRNMDDMLRNPTPPLGRAKMVAIKNMKAHPQGAGTKEEYVKDWVEFRNSVYAAFNNPDARTVVIEGDGDSWELQRLAEFGKLTKVPPLLYTSANAARRAFYIRGKDSGKICIYTNKVKAEYATVIDPTTGVAKVSDNGNEIRERTGNTERQGFADQDFLFGLQLTHLFKPAYYSAGLKRDIPKMWGVRINKCKANMDMIGMELWGEDCNMKTLLATVYPHIDLKVWGYK